MLDAIVEWVGAGPSASTLPADCGGPSRNTASAVARGRSGNTPPQHLVYIC